VDPNIAQSNPLRPLVSQWKEKIKLAMDFKKKEFQDDANTAMSFFNGPYDFMYGLKYRSARSAFVYTGDDDMPRPSFSMTVNKVAEMVQLFGPVLYHRNPQRQVNPRKPPMVPIELFGDPNDPGVQQQFMQLAQQVSQLRSIDVARAKLLEFYLNYTPDALDLKSHSRMAIDEAIIKGMGVLWTELYSPPGSTLTLAGSFWDSIDNLLIDPDGETRDHGMWCAKRCTAPAWKIEEEYGLPPGSVQGNLESYTMQALIKGDEDGDYRRKQGLTNDLVVYWKIFSKMGLGARLSGVSPSLRQEFDQYGRFCFLVVSDEMPYPLNLPPEVFNSGNVQEIQQRLQWPTPFWADDAWPFKEIVFHEIPRKVWPMSHLKPGMGELQFINWAYSFVAGKIKTACRDIIVVSKAVSEEMKTAILSGTDYELVELEKAHGTVSEVVQFLQHPQFQGDIWKVIEAVEANFEKRVGLTELMYGSSTAQLRSATEANVKQSQMSVRPDDMANKVEDFMSQLARQEALTARWHLEGKDMVAVMGPVAAAFWDKLMVPSDPTEILHGLEYRIESGSVRKPNKERDAANMGQAMQTLFMPIMNYSMQTMDFAALNQLIGDWAKSIDLDATKYLFKAPPPPPPQPPGAAPPGAPPQQGAQQPPQQQRNGQAPPAPPPQRQMAPPQGAMR
jgi:hypothetical protein